MTRFSGVSAKIQLKFAIGVAALSAKSSNCSLRCAIEKNLILLPGFFPSFRVVPQGVEYWPWKHRVFEGKTGHIGMIYNYLTTLVESGLRSELT